MSNSTNDIDPKTEPTKSTGYSDPEKKPDISVEDKKPEVDDYGYEKPAVDPEKKPDEEPAVEPEKKPDEEPEKVKDPATGYDKKPVVDPDKKPDEKPAVDPEKKPEEVTKEEIDIALGDLHDKEVISEFAVKHKLSKEQIEAYVELRKSEDTKLIEDNENKIKETRASWHDELKNDAEFGGENFDKNVDRVEKLLENHMPNTKKVLTDKGTMMPPYIMRDLLSLSKSLNPTTKLVTGDPSTPVKKEEGNFLDEMYK